MSEEIIKDLKELCVKIKAQSKTSHEMLNKCKKVKEFNELTAYHDALENSLDFIKISIRMLKGSVM